MSLRCQCGDKMENHFYMRHCMEPGCGCRGFEWPVHVPGEPGPDAYRWSPDTEETP